MSDLNLYKYHTRPVDIVGTPILTSSATPTTVVNQGTPGVVFSGYDMSQLPDDHGYDTNYPLLMKLFCSDVVSDSTGSFIVKINGSIATNNPRIQRFDTRNFTLTWNENGTTGWENILSGDATVSVQPLLPMTTVSMNCVLGIATDNIDRPEEN